MPQHRVGRLLLALIVISGLVQLDTTNSVAARGYGATDGVAFATGSAVEGWTSLAAASKSSGSPMLSLPWRVGEMWRLTGGPHGHTGNAKAVWSAVDFAGPRAGTMVRAARDGIVVRPCANLVEIRHADGWMTSYYHLADIAVRAGEHVARGAYLGRTSAQAGCGGSATGPHVHFTLWRYGKPVAIDGHELGDWTVRSGSRQYLGCLVRGAERRCAPSTGVLNNGAIGSL